MNRPLQFWRFSIVLLLTGLTAVESARCQVAALHGPIGRRVRTLDPTSPPQLAADLAGRSAQSVSPMESSVTSEVPAVGRSRFEQATVEPAVLRSELDPPNDRVVQASPDPGQAVEIPADSAQFLADPRAVAMLSHGIPRDVVLRRIALLSRLQAAAGRHGFSGPLVTSRVATSPPHDPSQEIATIGCSQ